MNHQTTFKIEEAVITLIDERINEQIEAKTAQQTRGIDRLENALVQLADAQSESKKHLSHQLHTLTNVVNHLTNAVKIMQSNICTMQGGIETLQENQQTLQENIHALQENQRIMQSHIRWLDSKVEKLDNKVSKLDNKVIKLISNSLEDRYLKHAGAYLGRVLYEAKGFKPYVMENELRDKLSESDYEELLLVDLLVGGIPKEHKDIYILLVTSISVIVNRQDVEQAMRRAEIMRRAGFRGIPTVAGESLTQDAKILAVAQNVVVLTNGKIDHWNEALVRTLTATAGFQNNISTTRHLKPIKRNNFPEKRSFFSRSSTIRS